MSGPNNGQALATKDKRLLPKGSTLRYTGETLLRTRPRTYQKVVMLLANPDWSDRAIAEACKVSVHTIAAVREREASTIEARKKTLTSVLVDVVTLGAEQMERKIGRSSLRDATIATGVSVDKVLALQGQSPVGEQVAVVQMRRPKSERKRVGRIMRLITRLLNEPGPLDPKDQLRVEALIKSMGRKEPAD
jgi:hypothetical protein